MENCCNSLICEKSSVTECTHYLACYSVISFKRTLQLKQWIQRAFFIFNYLLNLFHFFKERNKSDLCVMLQTRRVASSIYRLKIVVFQVIIIDYIPWSEIIIKWPLMRQMLRVGYGPPKLNQFVTKKETLYDLKRLLYIIWWWWVTWTFNRSPWLYTNQFWIRSSPSTSNNT